MIWLLVGVVIGACLGMLLMAMLSIGRLRDTEAVIDAAAAFLAVGTRDNWQRLSDAHKGLMAN